MITLKEAQDLIQECKDTHDARLTKEVETNWPDLVKYIDDHIRDAIFDTPQRDNIMVVWYFNTNEAKQKTMEYIELHGFKCCFLASRNEMTTILIEWRY